MVLDLLLLDEEPISVKDSKDKKFDFKLRDIHIYSVIGDELQLSMLEEELEHYCHFKYGGREFERPKTIDFPLPLIGRPEIQRGIRLISSLSEIKVPVYRFDNNKNEIYLDLSVFNNS